MGERQNEPMTPKAAAAFRAYYALGPDRSLAKLARNSGVNVGQLERWSSRHAWQDRIAELEEQELATLARKAGAKRSRIYLRTLDEYERRTADEVIGELGIQELNTIYDRMRPAEANAVAPAASLTILFPERADGPQ